MPDFASRRLASTSWVLLPMDETMPIPVTTTRLMPASLTISSRYAPRRISELGVRLHCRILAEQSDLEVEGAVDHRAIRGHPAVGDAKHELRTHHPLHVDSVHDLLDGRKHLSRKFEFAQAERAALTVSAEPTEEKPDQLPERVEAQASGHHRIAFEVAGEEPKVGLDVEFGPHQAFSVLAATLCDLGDAIEHQHRRQRQLRTFGEQFTPSAREKVLVFEA